MSSIKNRFSSGWAIGLFLGLACNASIVYASPISDNYADGDTLTATTMTNIKSAVNDNDGRITTNTNDINNLKGNLPSLTAGSCRANDGTVDANATRVGVLCVDTHPARASFGGCSADGTTGCDSVVAQSTNSGTAAFGMSWAQAARACANAGKRLLTPGEWMMAYAKAGSALGLATTGHMEYVDHLISVDAVFHYHDMDHTHDVTNHTHSVTTAPGTTGASGAATTSAPSTTATSYPLFTDTTAGVVMAGYIGPRTDVGGRVQLFANAEYDQTGLQAFLGFRCAR